jgi:hypothetical protein
MAGKSTSGEEQGMSEQPKGRAFELKVADAYRLLGYRVVPNTILGGKQTDLLVEQVVPGAPPVAMAIECKDHASPVGNENVLAFVNRVVTHRASNKIAFGVLISSSGFTANARQVAEDHPYISLLSWDELSAGMLDVHSQLSELVANYEISGTSEHYLPLSTELLSWSTMAVPSNPGPSLEDLIEEWRRSPDLEPKTSNSPSSIFVVGDFGAGKTTFLRHFQYERSKAHLEGEDIRVPLFVPLRNFRDMPDVTALMRASFRDTFARDLSADLLWQQISRGRFYVLLDGFDEIAERSDAARRLDLFYKFLPLLKSRSRTILTSRPAYFVGRDELHDLLKALGEQEARVTEVTSPVEGGSNLPAGMLRRKLIARHREVPPWAEADHRLSQSGAALFRLLPLDPERIKELLERYEVQLRRAGSSSEALMDFISNTYDLKDLSSRPLLLMLIVDSVIEGHLDPHATDVQYGASGLYEIYTDAKLHLDLAKGQGLPGGLSAKARRLLAEALAVFMYETETLDVDLDELLESVLPRHPELRRELTKSSLSTEEVKTDFATRSFVTLDKDGRCRFVHKTFRGFFLARMLRDHLDRDHPLFHKWLEHDALYFLGGFAPTLPAVGQALWAKFVRASPTERMLQRNMLIAFLYTSPNHENRSFSDVDITEADFDELGFRLSPMNKVIWRACDVRELMLDQVTWQETKIARSRISLLASRKSKIEATLDDSTIENLRFEDGSVARLEARSSAIGTCRLEEAALELVVDDSQITDLALSRSSAVCVGLSRSGVDRLRAEESLLKLNGTLTFDDLQASRSIVTANLDRLEGASFSLVESVGKLSLSREGAARLQARPGSVAIDERSVILATPETEDLPLWIWSCGVFGTIDIGDPFQFRSTPTTWGIIEVGDRISRSGASKEVEVVRCGDLLIATNSWYAHQVAPMGRMSSIHRLRQFADNPVGAELKRGDEPLRALLKEVREQFEQMLKEERPRILEA